MCYSLAVPWHLKGIPRASLFHLWSPVQWDRISSLSASFRNKHWDTASMMWYWDFYVTFVLLKVNQPAAEFSVPQKQIGRPLSSHSFFFPLKDKKRWCDSNLCVVSGLDESGLNGQDKSKRSAAHVIGKSFFKFKPCSLIVTNCTFVNIRSFIWQGELRKQNTLWL